MPDRPADLRPYQLEPNYFRVAYQLAAQRMHSYLTALDQSNGNGEPDAGEVPAPQAGTREARAAARLLRAAKKTADGLIEDVKSVETAFDARARQRWWVRGRRLKPAERRLRQFLSRTVLPSAELLKAGIMVAEGDRYDAERIAGPIRARVHGAKQSYRTAYNLACYEVAMAVRRTARGGSSGVGRPVTYALDTDRLDGALKALREALSGVHGARISADGHEPTQR
jgi:hypothetical protein